MDSLDLDNISNYLNVFLSEYVCHLQSYDPEHVDILNQLSDILKSLNKLSGKFNGKKSEFIRKKECIYKCEGYCCKAIGVYNMYNFKCDECNKQYGRESNHIKNY